MCFQSLTYSRTVFFDAKVCYLHVFSNMFDTRRWYGASTTRASRRHCQIVLLAAALDLCHRDLTRCAEKMTRVARCSCRRSWQKLAVRRGLPASAVQLIKFANHQRRASLSRWQSQQNRQVSQLQILRTHLDNIWKHSPSASLVHYSWEPVRF